MNLAPTLPASRALAASRPLAVAAPGSPDLVDRIKARSTLVALVQPAAWITELAAHPAATARSLGEMARHLARGEVAAGGADLGGMLNRAVHPTGFASGLYQAGLYLQAGADALVGAAELRAGFRDGDSALEFMGAADLVASTSSCAFALGSPTVALGLNLASNAAKSALVLWRPEDYSRIQKAKTVFDSLASVSAALMKTGMAPVPALAGYLGFGITQILYMNDDSFRARVDAVVDGVLEAIRGPGGS